MWLKPCGLRASAKQVLQVTQTTPYSYSSSLLIIRIIRIIRTSSLPRLLIKHKNELATTFGESTHGPWPHSTPPRPLWCYCMYQFLPAFCQGSAIRRRTWVYALKLQIDASDDILVSKVGRFRAAKAQQRDRGWLIPIGAIPSNITFYLQAMSRNYLMILSDTRLKT